MTTFNVMNSFIVWFLSQGFVLYTVFVPIMGLTFVTGLITLVRWRR